MEEPIQYDGRFIKGVEFFNECEFFEAHEAWEELWTEYQGPSRRFYQGLIQTAVCLHHFGNGNLRGAVKLYHSCRKYLLPYGPRHEGIDLDQLLAQLETCCRDIVDAGDEPPAADQFKGAPPMGEIDPDLIPEIHLDPPPGEDR